MENGTEQSRPSAAKDTMPGSTEAITGMESPLCIRCGYRCDPLDNFCVSCGYSLLFNEKVEGNIYNGPSLQSGVARLAVDIDEDEQEEGGKRHTPHQTQPKSPFGGLASLVDEASRRHASGNTTSATAATTMRDVPPPAASLEAGGPTDTARGGALWASNSQMLEKRKKPESKAVEACLKGSVESPSQQSGEDSTAGPSTEGRYFTSVMKEVESVVDLTENPLPPTCSADSPLPQALVLGVDGLAPEEAEYDRLARYLSVGVDSPLAKGLAEDAATSPPNASPSSPALPGPPAGAVPAAPLDRLWVSEDFSSVCLGCKSLFASFSPSSFLGGGKRRRHCRCCGLLYCGDCLSHRLALPEAFGYADKPQPVCATCASEQAAGRMQSPLEILEQRRRRAEGLKKEASERRRSSPPQNELQRAASLASSSSLGEKAFSDLAGSSSRGETELLQDHYVVLGIPRDASMAEITAAFKKRMEMAKLESGGILSRCQSLKSSYAVLRDEQSRQVYDSNLFVLENAEADDDSDEDESEEEEGGEPGQAAGSAGKEGQDKNKSKKKKKKKKASSGASGLSRAVDEDDLGRKEGFRGVGMPLRVARPLSAQCQVCFRGFNQIRRRHHCRRCGRSVCASCAPRKDTVPELLIESPAWICRTCITTPQPLSDLALEGLDTNDTHGREGVEIHPLFARLTLLPFVRPSPHSPASFEISVSFVTDNNAGLTELDRHALDLYSLNSTRVTRDFLWLQGELGKVVPLSALPPLPFSFSAKHLKGFAGAGGGGLIEVVADKHVAKTGLAGSGKHGARQKDPMNVCEKLQQYLRALLRHPILSNDIAIKAFLGLGEQEFQHLISEGATAAAGLRKFTSVQDFLRMRLEQQHSWKRLTEMEKQVEQSAERILAAEERDLQHRERNVLHEERERGLKEIQKSMEIHVKKLEERTERERIRLKKQKETRALVFAGREEDDLTRASEIRQVQLLKADFDLLVQQLMSQLQSWQDDMAQWSLGRKEWLKVVDVPKEQYLLAWIKSQTRLDWNKPELRRPASFDEVQQKLRAVHNRQASLMKKEKDHSERQWESLVGEEKRVTAQRDFVDGELLVWERWEKLVKEESALIAEEQRLWQWKKHKVESHVSSLEREYRSREVSQQQRLRLRRQREHILLPLETGITERAENRSERKKEREALLLTLSDHIEVEKRWLAAQQKVLPVLTFDREKMRHHRDKVFQVVKEMTLAVRSEEAASDRARSVLWEMLNDTEADLLIKDSDATELKRGNPRVDEEPKLLPLDSVIGAAKTFTRINRVQYHNAMAAAAARARAKAEDEPATSAGSSSSRAPAAASSVAATVSVSSPSSPPHSSSSISSTITTTSSSPLPTTATSPSAARGHRLPSGAELASASSSTLAASPSSFLSSADDFESRDLQSLVEAAAREESAPIVPLHPLDAFGRSLKSRRQALEHKYREQTQLLQDEGESCKGLILRMSEALRTLDEDQERLSSERSAVNHLERQAMTLQQLMDKESEVRQWKITAVENKLEAVDLALAALSEELAQENTLLQDAEVKQEESLGTMNRLHYETGQRMPLLDKRLQEHTKRRDTQEKRWTSLQEDQWFHFLDQTPDAAFRTQLRENESNLRSHYETSEYLVQVVAAASEMIESEPAKRKKLEAYKKQVQEQWKVIRSVKEVFGRGRGSDGDSPELTSHIEAKGSSSTDNSNNDNDNVNASNSRDSESPQEKHAPDVEAARVLHQDMVISQNFSSRAARYAETARELDQQILVLERTLGKQRGKMSSQKSISEALREALDNENEQLIEERRCLKEEEAFLRKEERHISKRIDALLKIVRDHAQRTTEANKATEDIMKKQKKMAKPPYRAIDISEMKHALRHNTVVQSDLNHLLTVLNKDKAKWQALLQTSDEDVATVTKSIHTVCAFDWHKESLGQIKEALDENSLPLLMKEAFEERDKLAEQSETQLKAMEKALSAVKLERRKCLRRYNYVSDSMHALATKAVTQTRDEEAEEKKGENELDTEIYEDGEEVVEQWRETDEGSLEPLTVSRSFSTTAEDIDKAREALERIDKKMGAAKPRGNSVDLDEL